jgi:hypothetical protein
LRLGQAKVMTVTPSGTFSSAHVARSGACPVPEGGCRFEQLGNLAFSLILHQAAATVAAPRFSARF